MTTEILGKEYKEGDRCPICGSVLKKAVLSPMDGCKLTDEQRTFLACRCLHAGDYNCVCGDPCWSFF